MSSLRVFKFYENDVIENDFEFVELSSYAELESKLAEKDALLSMLASLEERKFRELTEKLAEAEAELLLITNRISSKDAIIEKLKEQRNSYVVQLHEERGLSEEEYDALMIKLLDKEL